MTVVAALPENEQARLARLEKLMILDSASEPIFDRIAQLASAVCETEVGLISLVDENRQWFKANVGLDGVSETPRDIAFCSHAILQDEIFEVEDASHDVRFQLNPLVTEDPSIRFYAGVPLSLSADINIGTLCVIDQTPKKLTSAQRVILSGLADIALEALLIRERAIDTIQEKSTMLAAIVDGTDDAIVSKTLGGIVTSWNKGATQIFGYSEEEMVGKDIKTIFPDECFSEETYFIDKMKRGEPISHYETERLHKSGKRVNISASLSPIKNSVGEVIGVAKIARDITDQKALQNQFAAQHEQLRVTMDSIGDAVITTDCKGVVQYINHVAVKLSGWRFDEAVGQPLEKVFNIINENTRLPCESPVAICLQRNEVVGLANHTVLIHRDGHEYGIEDSAAPIKDKAGTTLGVVLVFHDVTAQREMANEISYRATHDSLTDLINRDEFELHLKKLINNQRNRAAYHALMYIDLDQFKVINDACGHHAGDTVLKDTSAILCQLVRNSDMVARIGGDEFAIILKDCTEEKALQIANDICKKVGGYRFQFDEKLYQIGASIGMVVIDNHWTSVSEIAQAADNACLEAKRTGRNRVHVHVDNDEALAQRKQSLQWASRITHALEHDGFALFSQRILPLNHKALLHAEVLVRMKDEAGDLVPPGAFLPAAERFHLISRIDRWVVKATFEWMRDNSNGFDHFDSVSINLSGQSLVDLTFHEYTKALITTIDIDYSKVCFEITETSVITNINDANQFIASLQAYGIKFSLDDFGSGASSFGYLNNLNVDYLKIDGQFIQDLLDNKIGQATVRCITEVAKITNAKTIAEWVDNEAVEDMLGRMGVDFTQGYLKHKPAPINHMLDEECQYMA